MLKNLIFRYSVFLLIMCLFSCGDSEQSYGDKNLSDNSSENDVSSLLMTSSRVSDLENLLNDSYQAKSLVVNGADSELDGDLLVSVSIDDSNISNIQSPKTDAELALLNLEESTIEHQKSIEELRKINANKDTTIASLSSINDELLSEIRRLKGLPPREAKEPSLLISEVVPKEEAITEFHAEISNLKNSLLLKSNEIKDLRSRNDSLEARISSLENTPQKNVILADPDFSSKDTIPSARNINLPDVGRPGTCTLEFDAVVTSYNGKSKEAFYTEFFVVKESLSTILAEGGVSLKDFSSVESYSELWARARKNSFLYPNLQKKIRSLLIAEVDDGRGKRVRTDINGSAIVPEIVKGNYFILGTAALGKVGVTWNIPVNLDQGLNRVSLTLANASWSM
jgi:hypothetical protein